MVMPAPVKESFFLPITVKGATLPIIAPLTAGVTTR
jgi:hypothetical protein